MAWIERSQNSKYFQHVILEESLVLPDSDGATESNVDSSEILRDLGDRKFLCQLEVEEASAGNGGVSARLLASLDGVNYMTAVADLGVNLDTTQLNAVAVGMFDASWMEAPFYKIQVFSDGTDTVDDATIKVTLAFLG